eukprot:TRINITY_DN96535_c0_g1_i1.p1 TRINITY_DN96535_c0_g1~~TRINITY_DN96535_c0_g1_i1.p1  ORF type:complete len:219 (-),score=24.82 TRINITY_DN96535_c0_g1_i1:112-768(-)
MGDDAPNDVVVVVAWAVSGEELHKFPTQLELLTVEAIKEEVECATGIPHFEQQLIFCGDPMETPLQRVCELAKDIVLKNDAGLAELCLQMVHLDHSEEIERFRQECQQANRNPFGASYTFFERVKHAPAFLKGDAQIMLSAFEAECKYVAERPINIDTWIDQSVIAHADKRLRQQLAFFERAVQLQQLHCNGRANCLKFALGDVKSDWKFVGSRWCRS